MREFFDSVRQAEKEGSPIWLTCLLIPSFALAAGVVRLVSLYYKRGIE